MRTVLQWPYSRVSETRPRKTLPIDFRPR
jgi:hypothetical protein